MSLLAARNLSLRFGSPPLFTGVSFQIDAGERVCLIGRNGAGKSSLLKILAGKIHPDSGEVVPGKNSRLAYLAQEVPAQISGTARDVVIAGLGDAGEVLRAYENHGADSGMPEARLNEILHRMEADDVWKLASDVEAALSRVGADPSHDFSSLSAGMKRRVLLARELVAKPNVLILDEPTNHLDVAAIEWLEEFMLAWKGAAIFVTHDRRFLKKVSTKILDLERGIVTAWDCDYETYLRRREALNESIAANEAEFDKLLAREEAWLRQGVKARRCRNEGRVRELQRLREIRKKRRVAAGNVKAQIDEGEVSGAKVIVARNVDFNWAGKPLIKNFSTTIMRGDKVGIIGANGIGKTTLLKILLGEIAPDSGEVKHGTNLRIAYFDQLRATLRDDKTLIENIAGEGADTVVAGGQTRNAISYLGDFLFSPDRTRSTVAMLSGGEKNRLLLAKIFLKTANVLVLDEPTNDLDIETLDLLEELLAKFDGTLLLVSHDREFLDNVTTSYLVFEGDGNIREFVGDYDSWKRERLAATMQAKNSPAKNATRDNNPATTKANPATTNPPQKKKLSYKETRELEALPAQIDALEAEQKTLAEKISNPDFYRDPAAVKATNERLNEIEEALTTLLARWEELETRK
ncbi:MAG: ATP-binding cassette domain-containing protein [Opitutae bacterium]|nr:ATP-binding cassette domain-containing protein [Opitutae bacterium]